MIPRIFRLGVVTCLAVVVMVVACSGGSEPALPAETVAVGTTTQPANTLVSAPTAIPGPTTELTNGKADAGSTPGISSRSAPGLSTPVGSGLTAQCLAGALTITASPRRLMVSSPRSARELATPAGSGPTALWPAGAMTITGKPHRPGASSPRSVWGYPHLRSQDRWLRGLLGR